MMFLQENVQAVMMLICEKHAPALMDRLKETSQGNWFVLPSAAAAQMGYRPHVSDSHSDHGYAVLGFAESTALAHILRELAPSGEHGEICPDCVAYEWDIRPVQLTASTRDPVCGRVVNCESGFALHQQSQLFFFCSTSCRDEFQKAPEKYLRPANRKRPAAETSVAESSVTETS